MQAFDVIDVDAHGLDHLLRDLMGEDGRVRLGLVLNRKWEPTALRPTHQFK